MTSSSCQAYVIITTDGENRYPVEPVLFLIFYF